MARKARSEECRLRIAESVRLKHVVSGTYAWTDAAIDVLRNAYTEGGYKRCASVFPQLTKGQIYAAIRRYAQTPVLEPGQRAGGSVWDSFDFNRRFMEALTGRSY